MIFAHKYLSQVAKMLDEFHRAFVPPGLDVRAVRATLIEEEHKEVQEALASGDREAMAKELSDLVYVCYGTALVYDIDLDRALEEVHKSNMTKLGDDGKPILREDGKALKGPNYRPPNMKGALR
jgi:predicted HAD superfamily Cof-like phosphohydrolase